MNVLLTGGSRGLGARIAEALAGRGARLALVARSRGPLEEVAARVGGLAFPADLTDPSSLEGLVARVEREMGPVDALINNAGVEHPGRFAERSPAELEAVVSTNLVSPMLLTRLVLPGMLARKRGSIVTLASLAGKIGLPYMAAYSATKAALLAWSNSLHVELRGTGVRCSLVTPGYVHGEGMFAEHGARPPFYLRSVAPDRVVAAVLRALDEGPREIVVSGRPFKPMQTLYALAPSLTMRLLGHLGLYDWFERTYVKD